MTTPLSRALAATIGARLRELRLERRLTIAEVARRTGIHRPIVGRLESGRHLQGLSEIARYAAAIGVDVADVVEVIDDTVETMIGQLADPATRAACLVDSPRPGRPPGDRMRSAHRLMDAWQRRAGVA